PISGYRGTKTDANSFPEFRKRRLRTAQTATRWLLARKPIHAELAGNGRMDRIDGAADPTASSSCLTSSKQSIGSAKQLAVTKFVKKRDANVRSFASTHAPVSDCGNSAL